MTLMKRYLMNVVMKFFMWKLFILNQDKIGLYEIFCSDVKASLNSSSHVDQIWFVTTADTETN